MKAPPHQDDGTMREPGTALAVQRAGGRHPSIGRASARMKWQHTGRKIVRIFLAAVGIIIAAGVIGALIGGIGFNGVLLTLLAIVAAGVVLAIFPRIKVPQRADLQTDDVRQLVGKTELWLEAQHPALPPAAGKIIFQIGQQLDALQLQLQQVDQKHPAAGRIRKLVGEDLPEMIESFQRIPAQMRYEDRAGSNPNQQLLEGLELISAELDSVTRQLGAGALDDLAIHTRYLDYKYGGLDMDSPAIAGQDIAAGKRS